MMIDQPHSKSPDDTDPARSDSNPVGGPALVETDRLPHAVQPQQSPAFFSVADTAHMLGMSEMTVYRAIAAGQFPAVRFRGRLIVPAKAIYAMVDAAVGSGGLVDAATWVPGGVA
jgi:excisionase family DNA binding protein